MLHVADGRGREVLDTWYADQPDEMLAGLKTVAMDMWPAYIRSTTAHVLDASNKIAFDKFHVAKYLGDAVDQVHRAEHKALKAETGDSTCIPTGSRTDATHKI